MIKKYEKWNLYQYIKVLILMVVLSIFFFITIESLDPRATKLLGIFISTILALVLDLLPIGTTVFISIFLIIVFNILSFEEVFSGFSNSIVWLIVFAIFLSQAFFKTGLGNRIGYIFLSLLGKNPLGLSYGFVFTDLCLAPFMVSNTSRAAGIILPILKGVANIYKGHLTLEEDRKKIDSFLILILFHSIILTSTLFLTASSSNMVAFKLAEKLDIYLTWLNWFLITCVPGFLCLICMPLIIHKMIKPKAIQNFSMKLYARSKLKSLGSLSRDEKITIFVFLFLIIFWIIGPYYGITATFVAFSGVIVLLLTQVLTWDDILSEKMAWDTLIWFGSILMMITYLQNLGFNDYLKNNLIILAKNYDFIYESTILFLGILGLLYYFSHYFFVSSSGHVSALYFLFLSIALSANLAISPIFLAVFFITISNLSACVTHYSSGHGIILFSNRFVTLNEWLWVSFVMTIFYISVFYSVGLLWWTFLHYTFF